MGTLLPKAERTCSYPLKMAPAKGVWDGGGGRERAETALSLEAAGQSQVSGGVEIPLPN